MKSIIIGTAGHIDHGKTALVKALTGIDADRLEEENRRGITIDIGFAHLELPAPNGEILRLGFVDVPGHERFVRNMLAGVGGIDLVLLVVAANESIKPQTREHFEICRLLGVRRGITVLTKSDLVDLETLKVVKLEVAEFLRGSFLDTSHSPIIAVSSLTGEGLHQLKQALMEVALQVPHRDSAALVRLPIDRVFTMKGFGTVVTGTLIAGTIHKDDELEVFPKRARVRVRGVQVHDTSVELSLAGQRTALNLVGIEKEELRRGMTLAPPATFNASISAVVSLTLLPSARPLKNRSRIHFHSYTAETIAQVVPHGKQQVAPGETAFVHLRLAEPLLLLPGDHFIIRQFSPVITIGGGRVLDASAMPTITSTLEILATGSPSQVLQERISTRWMSGLAMPQAVAETGWRSEFIEKHMTDAIKHGDILRIGALFVCRPAFALLKSNLEDIVRDFHKHNPLASGIGKEALREKLKVELDIFALAIDTLVQERKIEIHGEQVSLAGRGIVMKDEETESKSIIEESFRSAGLKTPPLKDVLAGLKVDKVRAQKIVTLLLKDTVLVKIADDLVFHREALENLKATIARYKTKSPKINVAQFKDLTGVSRKYAIPLLEFLDRERVTRRVGDERIIL